MTLKIAALAMAMAVPSMASQSPAGAPTEGLPAFANEAAFQAFLEAERRKAEAQQRREMAEQKMMAMPVPVGAPPVPPAPPAPAPVMEAATSLDSTAASADAAGSESITNNQTQGVDEGDIVKRSGDHLVVLRRGRLFTVRIGGDSLQPVWPRPDAEGPSQVRAIAEAPDGSLWLSIVDAGLRRFDPQTGLTHAVQPRHLSVMT